jgi:WD40 repeat protein/serine/threonine protein kinase/regulator of sirC expression with transglutaminase-like and TPR domain
MQPQPINVDEIYLAALALPGAVERAAFLDQACAGNPEQRERVERLLRAQPHVERFLESVAAPFAPTVSEPQIAEKPGTQIGPFKLLEQIGEGGFGIVFMAEQQQPVRRKVAFKILKPGMDSRQVIARFEAERQALALMDHPHIARVFDGGATESGRPYFVMELVKGVAITEYCDQHQLTPRERLELFVPVCHAVQHAHQKGIIHRDIKPSNVLVTKHDGKPIVKVIDFGVAKALGQQLTDKTVFTNFAQMIGTPLYMSPEQAELSGLDIDTRTDIYSLGVLLYELLTGTTPFDKERLKSAAFDEIRRIIREDEPPKPSTRLSELSRSGLPSRTSGSNSGAASHTGSAGTAARTGGRAGPTSLASIAALRKMEPRKLSQLVRGDLDWIVMKALEKDRNRRYETANGFALDIQRYLADEPVAACPPSATYRLRKFARRNRAAFAAAAAAAAVLVIMVVGLAVSNVLVTAQRDQKVQALAEKETALKERGQALAAKEAALAEARENYKEAQKQERLARASESKARQQEDLARKQELLARQRFYSAQTNLAMQAWQSGETARALELLEGQRPKAGDADLRGFEWYYLWRLCQNGHRLTLRGHRSGVRSVTFLQDGKTLASCSSGELRLWDMATGKQRKLLRGSECLAVSADGSILATGSGQTTALYDVATLKTLAELQSGGVESLAFSPDGSALATGTASGVVMLWNTGTGEKLFTLSGHTAKVLAVAFSPDGKTLATATGWGDGVTKLWDLTANPPRITQQFDRPAKNGLTFLPDGKTLLIAGWGLASFVDVTNGQVIQEQNIGTDFNFVSAALSPDGKTFAFGLEERSVKLWDRTKGFLRTYGHLKEVWCVAFSPDGRGVAAGTEDGLVQIWNVSPEPEINFPSAAGYTCAALSRDCLTLALGTSDGKIKLCDPSTGQERATLAAHNEPISSLAFSTDGKTVVSASGPRGGGTGEVKVWETATNRQVATLGGHQGSVSSIAISPNGQTVASGSWDGTAKLWQVATQKLRFTLTGREVAAVAFSPDGATLVTGGYGGVGLWDTDSGEKIADWIHPGWYGSYVLAMAFSPNGKVLATAGTAGTGTIRLWDAATGQLRGTLKGHTAAVYSIAFDEAGQTLASASTDGSVRLWNVVTGQECINLKSPPGGTWPFVTFGHDGKALVVGTPDGTVQLLRAADDREALASKTELNPDDPDDPDSASALINEGDRLRTSGRLDDAAIVYSKAEARLSELVAVFPNEPDYRDKQARLHNGRAFAHFFRQRWEPAISDFSKAIELAPQVHTNWWHRGHAYLHLAQWDKAAADFGYVIDHWPDGPDGRYLRAVALAQMNEPDKALADLRQAIALGFKNVEQLKNDSRLDPLRTREDFAELLLALQPDSSDLWYRRGLLRLKAGKWDEAVAGFGAPLCKQPQTAAEWQSRAEHFVRLALWPEAAADYARADDLQEPADAFGCYVHALTRLYAGDVDGSRKVSRRMAERFAESADPEHAHLIAATGVLDSQPLVEPARLVALAARAAADQRLPWRAARLGAAHYRAGGYERAVAALQESLAINPNWDRTWVHSCLAMAQHRLGNAEQARAALDEARRASDERVEAMLAGEIGFVPAAWWDILHAELLYREARTLIDGSPPPDDSRLLVVRGRALEIIGRADEARAAFARALELKPDELLSRVYRLPHVSQTEAFAAALADLRQLLNDHPDQTAESQVALARAHVHLARSLLELKRQDEMESALAQIDSLPPPSSDVFIERGRFRLELKQPDRALADFSAAIEREGKPAAPARASPIAARYTQIAWQLIGGLRLFPEAERVCRETLAVVGELDRRTAADAQHVRAVADLEFALGWSLVHQRRSAEAAGVFNREIEHLQSLVAGGADKPDDRLLLTRTYTALGIALADSGQLEQALEAHRRGLALVEKLAAEFPDEPRHRERQASCLTNLANVHSRLGRHADALMDRERSLELVPNSAEAHNNLAWLLATCPEAKLRDPKRAVELASKAVELAPAQGTFRNTLGTAWYRAGEWKGAIEALTKSQELGSPSPAHDWFFLAMAEWQLGNKGDAHRWYDKASQWINENQKALEGAPENAEELKRFRTEAKDVLGIKDQ